MKHIYLFSTDSIAGDYGIGTYLKALKVCLRSETDITLTVVELQSAEKEFSVIEMDEMRYIKIPSPIVHPNWQFQAEKMDSYNLAVCCLLKKYVRAEDKNVFHLNFLQHDSLVKYLREIDSSCHIIFTIHYLNRQSKSEGVGNNSRGYNQEKHTVRKRVYESYSRMKAMCKTVDKVICLSLHTFNMLQAEYELPLNKLALIANGLHDEALILNGEQKRKCKEGFSFTGNDKVVLFVGRLDETKGLLLLLKAFKKVITYVSDAHLIIVGDGKYDEFLKECTSLYSKVSFTGRVNKDLLYQLYQIADVGVHPSLHEQCSYVAIEMMMHGIPVIGFNFAGIGEMIKYGYNGYKIDYISNELLPIQENTLLIEKLGDYIIKVLQHSTLRQELSKNSRMAYLDLYDEKNLKKKILDIYSYKKNVVE